MSRSNRFLCSLLIIPFMAIMVYGCNRRTPDGLTSNTVAVTGAVPVIDIPIKPSLESLDPDELVEYAKLPLTARNKLQSNDKKLKMYSAQLLVGIEDYNVYAAVRNKTSLTEVGVKGQK